ncbi:MAG: prepilin-type N-terminal cleavage/methylation domain-containing protein [Candidatus Pacebacteria bacterium]|nr:prepilin-type N-terminal cleavage/methylation domain-containing protein [Candidatus Paceibacterota bacterium]
MQIQNSNYKNKFSIKTPSDNSAWPPHQPMVGVGDGFGLLGSHKSFTLVELMIVIAILAILSAIVIFALNPSELFKKSRDSRRITDIQTLYKGISFMES